MTETIKRQRAAYVGLLLDLTRQADASRIPRLCDRIERAIDSTAIPEPMMRRHSWPLLRRGQL